ncbi:hypothetical protein CF392_02845 [Tamilnaduibacter salinus]|uniref:Uncharacterized protein n=1 Tax=Tamilnaduibacter salinus TaxID=1484056 RepID=A0A2A2I709_9GAMM|nr:hypothetical protein [Tamilnaduibacter salinus]PAV27086.1 hypothetical protein CF392_02845 [Tamilnaduibacter salinus]
MTVTAAHTEFLTSVIRDQTPQEVLQVGLGDFDLTLSVCQTLNTLDDTALTLLTGTRLQHAEFLKAVRQRNVDALMDVVELNWTPADEVLPDLYFQNRSVDLAIINEVGPYDQALVSLYYVDKMLASRGTLVIHNADTSVMKTLCQYLVNEREYTVQHTLGGKPDDALIPRLLRRQFHRAPGFVKNTVKTVIHPDLLRLDEDPRLQGSMVVLTGPVAEGDIDMDFDTLLESILEEERQ